MLGTTLYKKDSKGKVREWTAWVVNSAINVQHGLVDGQLQTELTYCTGKNIGKANETTPEQQAVLECSALYDKKVNREGYKRDLSEPDALLAPMLALDYSKVPHRVPDDTALFLSPKLDGCRAIWIQGKGFQSRKGKFYKIPHLEEVMKDVEELLDGEIYLHGKPLNEIVSAVKKQNSLTPLLEFHVFDVVSPLTFEDRLFTYEQEVKKIDSPFVKAVPQVCRNKSEILDSHHRYLAQNFEGTMIRVPSFPYEHTRSASLFKYKDFQESEYEIKGVLTDKEGNGILEFDGFKARSRGTDAKRRHQVEHPELYIGKLATIRYFTLTPFGIPQFCVCIAVRDYE